MKNKDIKEKAKSKGVYLYEIAFHLGISEPTINRWLRYDLSPERKAAILTAIDELATEKRAAEAGK